MRSFFFFLLRDFLKIKAFFIQFFKISADFLIFVLSFVTRSVIRISILLFLLLLFLQEHVTTAQNTNTKTIKGLTFFPINIFISVAIASCLQFFKFSYSILLSFTDKCVIIHILSRVCKSEKYGTIYHADTNRL